jgi:hypothetical protein
MRSRVREPPVLTGRRAILRGAVPRPLAAPPGQHRSFSRTGKSTGNFAAWRAFSGSGGHSGKRIQWLASHFPNRGNREFLATKQRFPMPKQGIWVGVHFSHTCIVWQPGAMCSHQQFWVRRTRCRTICFRASVTARQGHVICHTSIYGST